MKSMLVIGLGRFGRHLALKLAELGNEVMIVDKDEAIVNKLAPFVTSAHIGDCMEEEVVKSLGVRNFDICFVCMSENFQSSLEITSLLKENGAKMVISKTDREIHAKFLQKIGADAVIHPERDMAWRSAMKYTANNVFDFIEFTPEYGIFEINVPEAWVGKTIRDLRVREKFGINIIGTKVDSEVIPMVNADHLFLGTEHLFVAGKKEDILRLMDK